MNKNRQVKLVYEVRIQEQKEGDEDQSKHKIKQWVEYYKPDVKKLL